MLEKARSGIYPSFAPVGYRNVDGPNGKRIIVPDPDDRGDNHGVVCPFRDRQVFSRRPR